MNVQNNAVSESTIKALFDAAVETGFLTKAITILGSDPVLLGKALGWLNRKLGLVA